MSASSRKCPDGSLGVAEDAVDFQNAFPREAFALVFPPDDVAEGAPDVFGDLFHRVPERLVLQSGEESPFFRVAGGSIEAFAFGRALVPFMTFHAGMIREGRGRSKIQDGRLPFFHEQGRFSTVRNGSGRDVLKVWLYAAAVVVLAAWVSPLLYNAGKAMSEVTSGKPTNGFLEWLGKCCREAEFPAFFLFSVGAAAVLLFLPFSEWLDLKGRRRGETEGQRLRSSRRGFLEGVTGGLLAGGLLLLTGYGLMSAGSFVWIGLPTGDWKWLLQALPLVFLAVVVREWLVRGVALGIFLRGMKPGAAILLAALLSLVIQLLVPPAGFNVPDPDADGIGFQFLKMIGLRLADPQVVMVELPPVFAMGCLLGYARWRTASLWLPIGLSLGWQCAHMIFTKATKPVPQPDEVASLLSGREVTQGLIPLAAVLVTCALVYFLTQRDEDDAHEAA